MGEKYEVELETIGGVVDYEWTLETGDLPDGLDLSLDGEVSGTPTAEEDQTFTAQVEDEAAETDTQEFTISIAAE